MKRNISILFLAIAAVSCNTSEIVPDSQEHTYIFEIQSDSGINPDSKATLGEQFIEWESGDKIGTFAGGLNNGCGDVTIASPCTFEVKTSSALSAGDKVYAYAPYSESAGTAPSSLTLVIPSEQSYNHISMPMVAVPYTVSSALAESSSSSVASMRFCNTASIVRLLVYSDGTVASGEKISGITISSSADICGSYSLDIRAVNPGSEETLSLTPVSGNKSISLSVPEGAIAGSGPESAMVVPFVLSAGAHDLTISVTTDKATYIKSTSSALTFVRNHVKGLKFDLSKASVSEISVTPSQLQSFKKGTTSVYSLSMTGVSDVSVSSCPEGWSAVLDGESLSVTSPSDDTHALAGNVVLSGTASHGAYVKEIPVRLAGINSKSDFDSFADAMGRVEADHNAKVKDAESYSASLSPFLVDGWISLNTDISLTEADFYNNYYVYVLHHLYEPLDGNGHTIKLNVQAKNKAGFVAFSQHIDKPVRNLKFAGSIVSGNLDNTGVAVLGIKLNNDITIENVHSTVDITVNKPAPYVSGLIAECNGGASTVKGCSYGGTITINAETHYIGGIVANNASQKGEKQIRIQDCEFSGTISYASSTHHAQPRMGGIMGSQERNGVISGCTNRGKMLFDLHDKSFATANHSGIGGILGRCNGITDGYTMYTKVSGCTFTGQIIITNYNPGQERTYINKITGTALSGYDSDNSIGNVDSGEIIYRGLESASGHFSIMQVSSRSPYGSSPDNIGNSYILKTSGGKVIVMDGGLPEEADYLKSLLKNRYGAVVDQWWISHPHSDHIGALLEILKNENSGITVKEIYHSRFPESLGKLEPYAWTTYTEPLYRILDESNTIKVIDIQETGGLYELDGVLIKVLGVTNPELTATDNGRSPYNNSSMILRVWDASKSVLFLGDAQVECGDKLLNRKDEYANYLNADYVQMAHHGQQGVSESFYKSISFKYCLWPTPTWVYYPASNSALQTEQTKTWIRNIGIGEDKWYVSCLISDWYLE